MMDKCSGAPASEFQGQRLLANPSEAADKAAPASYSSHSRQRGFDDGSVVPGGSASHSSHSRQREHHQHRHAQASQHPQGHHLLQVEGLNVSFSLYDSAAAHWLSAERVRSDVICDLNIGVHGGEIVAIVGASGSGKTLLADCLMGQFQPNATVSGRIWFDGLDRDAATLRALRGHGISLVPQSLNYLDPLMRVGRQVEGFAAGKDGADGRLQHWRHRHRQRRRRRQRRAELFARYGLDPAVARLYPFELSGGMARRVLLCCALMDEPRVIIADEPTPGLDHQLARLVLKDFRQFADTGGGVLLISHDIELALDVADRIAVFKDGTVVEECPVADFASPATLRHPFSKALWQALPEHGMKVEEDA
jgi:ABC-type glutathione transport system ATPase component